MIYYLNMPFKDPEQRKLYMKEYNEKNREKKKKNDKEYNEANKEKIKKY
jgi:single-stranded DNA-specific DHH superfamily exonuclease